MNAGLAICPACETALGQHYLLHMRAGSRLGERLGAVDLAAVDKDVRVGVGGERQLPLTDNAGDLGPCAAVPVEQ